MKIYDLTLLTIFILFSNGQVSELHSQTTHFDNKSISYTDNSFGGNFFIGNGIYNGNISGYFSNPFYVGINLDYYKNGIVFQFEDQIGFGKTKNDIEYTPQEIWNKGNFVLSGMISLSLGYCLIDNDNIMIVPISGIGFNKLSVNIDELYDFKNEFKPIIPHIKFGCYLDFRTWRFFKNNQSFNDNDGSYACPRLSFGYTKSISNTDYPEYYGGNQFYITLGFGGLGKI